MKKWKILILMVLLIIPLVTALHECKPVMTPQETPCLITSTWSYTNCTNTTMNVYNKTGMWIINYTFTDFGNSTLCNTTWNINTIGSYNNIITNGDSGEITIEAVDMGGSTSITIFVLLVAGIIFLLPLIMNLIKQTFTKNIIIDLITRRCCYVLGAYLMVLNSSIMATIAENAGLNLTSEMFFYMKLFGWMGYLFMAFMVIKTFFDIIKITKNLALRKRMGENLT